MSSRLAQVIYSKTVLRGGEHKMLKLYKIGLVRINSRSNYETQIILFWIKDKFQFPRPSQLTLILFLTNEQSLSFGVMGPVIRQQFGSGFNIGPHFQQPLLSTDQRVMVYSNGLLWKPQQWDQDLSRTFELALWNLFPCLDALPSLDMPCFVDCYGRLYPF